MFWNVELDDLNPVSIPDKKSIFCDTEVVRDLSFLYENFVIVPADKASYNYTFVCKRDNNILVDELGLTS